MGRPPGRGAGLEGVEGEVTPSTTSRIRAATSDLARREGSRSGVAGPQLFPAGDERLHQPGDVRVGIDGLDPLTVERGEGLVFRQIAKHGRQLQEGEPVALRAAGRLVELRLQLVDDIEGLAVAIRAAIAVETPHAAMTRVAYLILPPRARFS